MDLIHRPTHLQKKEELTCFPSGACQRQEYIIKFVFSQNKLMSFGHHIKWLPLKIKATPSIFRFFIGSIMTCHKRKHNSTFYLHSLKHFASSLLCTIYISYTIMNSLNICTNPSERKQFLKKYFMWNECRVGEYKEWKQGKQNVVDYSFILLYDWDACIKIKILDLNKNVRILVTDSLFIAFCLCQRHSFRKKSLNKLLICNDVGLAICILIKNRNLDKFTSNPIIYCIKIFILSSSI